MLKEKLSQDLKIAQKNRDEGTLLVLRMVLSSIKNAEIEKKSELDDEGILGVLVSEAKKREDSIDQFKTGGREDLAEKEEKELALLKQYLPEQLGEDDVRAEVVTAIEKSGAKEPSEMGKVMGILVPKLKGRADGKLISKIVQEELSKIA